MILFDPEDPSETGLVTISPNNSNICSRPDEQATYRE
jgi:hypothetical protein